MPPFLSASARNSSGFPRWVPLDPVSPRHGVPCSRPPERRLVARDPASPRRLARPAGARPGRRGGGRPRRPPRRLPAGAAGDRSPCWPRGSSSGVAAYLVLWLVIPPATGPRRPRRGRRHPAGHADRGRGVRAPRRGRRPAGRARRWWPAAACGCCRCSAGGPPGVAAGRRPGAPGGRAGVVAGRPGAGERRRSRRTAGAAGCAPWPRTGRSCWRTWSRCSRWAPRSPSSCCSCPQVGTLGVLLVGLGLLVAGLAAAGRPLGAARPPRAGPRPRGEAAVATPAPTWPPTCTTRCCRRSR